jgi:anti-sigma B factor antagonist
MASVNGGSRAEIGISEPEPGRFVAAFSGELDIVSVEGIEAQVEDLLARPATRVDLDLTDVTFMDSSGLAVLVRIANQFGPLRVSGARPLVRRVIEVTGLTEILALEEEAP